MRRIYKGQEFFNISDVLNQLYNQYKINTTELEKCEIHGNKKSIETLIEFFLINGEIPILEKQDSHIHIKINSMILKDSNIKNEIVNLLSFHSYEFNIEISEPNIIYIILSSANFLLIHTQEINS